MPKLNATVDQLELTTNKVFGNTPSKDWTDMQYPSAKTLYETYLELSDKIEDVTAEKIGALTSANFVFTDGTLYITTQ